MRDYVQKGSRIPRGAVGRPGERQEGGDLNHLNQSSPSPQLKPFQRNKVKYKSRTVMLGMKAAEGSTIQGGGTQRWLLKEATFFECLATALRMGKCSWPTPTLNTGTPKSTGKVITFCHENRDGAPCKYRGKKSSKSHTETITKYQKIIIYGHKPTDDCNLVFQNKIKNERSYAGTT